MKKPLITLLFSVGVIAAMAYDYPYLIFQKSDMTETALSVESLTLSISGTEIIATNADGTESFTLSELNKMEFSTTTTDVEESEYTEDTPVEIYTITGIYKGVYTDLSQAMQTLPKGLYIVKSESKTFKMLTK